MVDMRSDWTHPTLPRRWVHRDLVVRLDEREGLQFGFYNNDDRAAALGDRSIEEIVNNGLPDPPELRPPFWADREPSETPLDLGVKGMGQPLYIILRIVGPPNMAFRPDVSAITHKRSTDAERARYGLLRHVVSEDMHLPNSPGGRECRKIYFACKPDPGGEEFRDSLNLQVRLRQAARTPGGRGRILDIIIDPDVGYPGGSLVDPEG